MFTIFVDKMDNEHVGIKHLVNCHKSKFSEVYHTGKFIHNEVRVRGAVDSILTKKFESMECKKIHVQSYNRKLKQKSKYTQTMA